MADNAPDPISKARLQELTKLYSGSIKKIEAEIGDATDFGRVRRAGVLRNVRQILADLQPQMEDWADTEMEKQYALAVAKADGALAKLNAADTELPQFTAIDREAIAALSDEVKLGFAESIRGVARGAENILSQATKLEIAARIAEGTISGDTRKAISRQVKGILSEKGITSLTDKAGRTWELDRYTQMLVRTKAVEARNVGLGNRIAQRNYDLVQVSTFGATHAACATWEGKILSYTGQTQGYPTYADAKAAGLFHPNCRHQINVLIPELAKMTNGYSPEPTVVIDQNEAQTIANDITPKQGEVAFPGGTKFKVSANEQRIISENDISFTETPYRRYSSRVGGSFNRMDKQIYLNLRRRTTPQDRAHSFYHEAGHMVDYLHTTGVTSETSKAVDKFIRGDLGAERSAIFDERLKRNLDVKMTDDQFKDYRLGLAVKVQSGSLMREIYLPQSYLSYAGSLKEIYADAYAVYRTEPLRLKKIAPNWHKYFQAL